MPGASILGLPEMEEDRLELRYAARLLVARGRRT